MRVLKSWEVTPTVKIISKFYDHPGFIDACVDVATQYNISDYDYYIFSYHGLPERHIRKGSAHYGGNTCKLGSCCDKITKNNQYCYRANCFETTRQLVKKLNIPEGQYETTFQSRLDDKWIKPYSDKVIAEKAKEGKKRILVFSPAFVSDCLETIYEIGTEYNEIFKENGGDHVQLVESLNVNNVWVETVKAIVVNT
jgi:ferrochelatase